MSNLLKEAIVDAKALKEAALKNAEATIIDKYSDEVKQTIESLLEQDELDAVQADFGADPMADPMADPTDTEPTPEYKEVTEDEIPLAATDNLADEEGKNLESFPEEGEEVEFNVNLGALQEAIQELKQEAAIDEEIEITEEDLAELLSNDDEVIEEEEEAITIDDDDEAKEETADSGAMAAAGLEEDQEVSDELLDAVMERLTVDMSAELSGWAGRSAESVKWEMEKGLAARRSTDAMEELEPLKKAQEELTFENKQLKQQVSKYKQVVGELKETLVETNLSNGRLLYTNRVLRNTSLNERQKTRIVEAISNAGSVTEAKTIYDTLQSTVQATPKRSPQSLSEAIGRRSSVIRASRQESTAVDPISDRMQRLAGIK